MEMKFKMEQVRVAINRISGGILLASREPKCDVIEWKLLLKVSLMVIKFEIIS